MKEHIGEAIDRAKALKEFQNPSSNIYKLVEILSDKL
ncbi:MAG: RloB family protein [Paludibacteraceae bacterium]|nr:RloB family protein [Paludibacteraceae bacterium]